MQTILLLITGFLLMSAPLKSEHQTIEILLTNPRTVSTAFEKSMMARGDHKILHEPWESSYAYHHGHHNLFTQAPPQEFIEAKNYQEVKNLIYQYSVKSPVFVKDMIWCMTEEFLQDDELLSDPNVTLTFLIRDPSKSMESLFLKGLAVENTSADEMFEAIKASFRFDVLVAIAEKYKKIRGKYPMVIEAEDLCLCPEKILKAYCQQAGIPFMTEMLAWQSGMPEDWKHYADWHLDAASSTGFFVPKRHEPKPRFSQVPIEHISSLEKIYQEQRPYYEQLKKIIINY